MESPTDSSKEAVREMAGSRRIWKDAERFLETTRVDKLSQFFSYMYI